MNTTSKLQLLIDMIMQNSRNELNEYAQVNGGAVPCVSHHILQSIKEKIAFIKLLESCKNQPAAALLKVKFDGKFVRIAITDQMCLNQSGTLIAHIGNCIVANWKASMYCPDIHEWIIYLNEL